MLEGLPPGVRRLLRLPRELRRQVVDDVDAEIRFHLDSRVDELMAGGMEREAAERRAREEFGDVQEARRALGARTARTERRRRRLVWLRQLGTDLRYGWRKLRARPGFAVTAILTFALGIGATTAIFSVMYAVLLRPLPYPRSDRLVQLWDVHPGGDDHNVVSSGNYLAWRDRADSFRDLGAYGQNFGLGLVGKTGEPVHVVATTITPSTFRILGASAAAGRIFTAREGRPDGGAVALLSYRLWQTRFGGDTAVIGRSVDLNDAERTIVGVMPPTFAFPNPRVDVWLPRAFGARDRSTHDSHQWRVIGRLRDGVTLRKARAEIRVITDQLRRRYPEAMEGWGVNVVPFRSDLVAGVRPLLLALFAMVVLVLLITCANLANLLLARALGREREVAVRAALGAGRVRLVRQFLTESLVVSLLGSALGVGVVALALPGLLTLIPPDIPLLTRVRIDPVVLAFSTAVTMGATLLFGLVPALRVTAADPAGALGTRGGGRAGPGGSRIRSGLLVVEVALSVVLLVGTGLLVRSFLNLRDADPGVEPDHVLAATVDVPSSRYPDSGAQTAFYRHLLDRVAALPGVVSAAGTAEPPVVGYDMTFSFAIRGRPSPRADGMERDVPVRAVTPGYFATMGIPLERGRAFDDRDRPESPHVAVINRALARRSWPDRNPMGQRLSFGGPTGPDWWEVVGVVGDVKNRGADLPAQPAIYIPRAQKPWDWMSWLTVVARTRGDPTALANPFRRTLWDLDDRLPVQQLTTMKGIYAESSARRRFAATLVGAFGALALVLGLTGAYGVLSYTVGERRREFGVRMALGASRTGIAASVVGRGLRLALVGTAIGLAGALWLSRYLRSLLFEVAPTDGLTVLGVPVLVLLVAALAAYVPALRATRIDPAEALRAE